MTDRVGEKEEVLKLGLKEEAEVVHPTTHQYPPHHQQSLLGLNQFMGYILINCFPSKCYQTKQTNQNNGRKEVF